jgi:hypothetical protein
MAARLAVFSAGTPTCWRLFQFLLEVITQISRTISIALRRVRAYSGFTCSPVNISHAVHSRLPLPIPHLMSNSRELLLYRRGDVRISFRERARDVRCHLFDVAKWIVATNIFALRGFEQQWQVHVATQ